MLKIGKALIFSGVLYYFFSATQNVKAQQPAIGGENPAQIKLRPPQ